METDELAFTDRCPQGHALAETRAPAAGWCDVCRADIARGAACRSCAACDHAVCGACFARGVGSRAGADAAARTIQSKARGKAAQRRFRVVQAAVLAIQTSWRGFAVRRAVTEVLEQGRQLQRRASFSAKAKLVGTLGAGTRRFSSPLVAATNKMKARARLLNVGGSEKIENTGKGERMSTLLEVLGLISALMLALAMDGFGAIGDDEPVEIPPAEHFAHSYGPRMLIPR